MRTDFLTDAALKHIKTLLASKPEGSFFRISVDAGGCNGFQYVFKIDDAKQDGDSVFDQNGIPVVIDAVSLPFLETAQLDFVEDLMGSYFKVDNPEAESSCGCGNSFSL